jgi:carbon-monoxide dehydrogenase small subunit
VINVRLVVNGTAHELRVPARRTLADLLRHDLKLFGTHVGCEHGVCGACTVLIYGAAARSCLTLAPQADGCEITTIEGLAADDGSLHPLQQALLETHGFQCGFCTPGFIMAAVEFLRETPRPTLEQARDGMSGNLCRCTGYESILRGIVLAGERTG